MAAAAFFQHMASASTNAKAPKPLATPQWVEKYRPKNMDDVVYQDEVVGVLKKSIETNEFPHLLFYGPPGTGKTSTILAISRELFGPQLMKERVLELNASDERGINVIRTKVKSFAQVAVGNTRAKGYPSPPFKIIILDEADSMTPDAQSALRRTMEVYSKVTRFCLICNYVTRIIEPLASRCAKFRFRPLTVSTIGIHLKSIMEKEHVVADDEAVSAIVNVSGGDMRKAITLLQSCYRWKGEEGVTAADVTDISGVVPRQVVEGLLTACQSQSFDEIQKAIADIVADGFSASILIDQLVDRILADGAIQDMKKARMSIKVAEVEKCLLDGADEELQLLNLAAFVMDILAKP